MARRAPASSRRTARTVSLSDQKAPAWSESYMDELHGWASRGGSDSRIGLRGPDLVIGQQTARGIVRACVRGNRACGRAGGRDGGWVMRGGSVLTFMITRVSCKSSSQAANSSSSASIDHTLCAVAAGGGGKGPKAGVEGLEQLREVDPRIRHPFGRSNSGEEAANTEPLRICMPRPRQTGRGLVSTLGCWVR